MSRRLRAAIAAVCVAVAVLLVWLDHNSPEHKRQPQGKSEEQLRAWDTEKYHGKTFTVSNVVDGDTIDIDVPDGEYEHTRIRLWGIDTPESKSPKVGVMYCTSARRPRSSQRRLLSAEMFGFISTTEIAREVITAESWPTSN